MNMLVLEIAIFDSFDGSFTITAPCEGQLCVKIRNGRFGWTFMTAGFYLLIQGADLLVSKVKRRITPVLGETINLRKHVGFWIPASWRRGFYVFLSSAFCILMVVIVELTFTTTYTLYLPSCTVGMKVFQFFVEKQIYTITQNALLVTPLQLVFLTFQQIFIMAGEKFTDFIGAFYLQFVVSLIESVHFQTSNHDTKQKIRSYISRGLKACGIYVGEGRGGDDEEDILSVKDSILEPMVNIMAVYASSTMSLLFLPIIMLILYYFDSQIMMAANYNITVGNLLNYLLFSLILMPTRLLSDVLVLNVQELYHGHKVYEYLAYLNFRFKTRKQRWQTHQEDMDLGVKRQVRTLDHFGFSSQYYFAVSLHAFGIILIIFGLVALLHQNHNALGDMATPIITLTFWGICTVVQQVCIDAGNVVGIWNLPVLRKRVQVDSIALTDPSVPKWSSEYRSTLSAVNDSKVIHPRMMIESRLRLTFVNHNRPWIMAQFGKMLTVDNLAKLGSMHEILIRKLGRLLLVKNADISDSSEDTEEGQQVKIGGFAKNFALMWVNKVRSRMKLLKAAGEITKRSMKRKCQICESATDLLVMPSRPLKEVLDMYELSRHRRSISVKRWLQFLSRVDITFVTLCRGCEKNARKVKNFTLNPQALQMARVWLLAYRTNREKKARDNAYKPPIVISDSSSGDEIDELAERDSIEASRTTHAIMVFWWKLAMV